MVEFLEGLGLSPQLLIFVISMVPFVELRGGIIVGLALELPWWEVLPICFIGNIFPIPFVILFGRKIIDWLGKTKLFGRFVARYKLKLAEKSNLSQQHISRIENGIVEPEYQTIYKLAYALDISVDTLIENQFKKNENEFVYELMQKLDYLSNDDIKRLLGYVDCLIKNRKKKII